jgi:hypothetical protein
MVLPSAARRPGISVASKLFCPNVVLFDLDVEKTGDLLVKSGDVEFMDAGEDERGNRKVDKNWVPVSQPGVGRSTPTSCPPDHALRDLRNSRQVINIEQIPQDACLYICGFLRVQATRMFSGQYEKWDDPHIIALVELDVQKMRVHIVLKREAMRERLRELEYPSGTATESQSS